MGLLCATMIAMLGNNPEEIQENVCFLAFSMSMLFTKLHFLWHTTPDLWQSTGQTENILSSPNVNYMSSPWWVTWEWWRVSARTILPSEWCCGNTTGTGLQGGHLHSQAQDRLGTAQVFCFYRLTQNALWRHITLPPQLTKMLLFPLTWKLGVLEKTGKKCHTFPDCLYFSCILTYLNCLHFKIAQRTKYKGIEKIFCVRDLLQLSSVTLLYKISRACISRISLQVMQASNKK